VPMKVGFRRSSALVFFIAVVLTARASAGMLAGLQAEEQQAEEELSEEQKELNSDLIAAATSGDQASVRDLISRGGDVNAVAGIGASTALMRSVFQGNLDVVEILIEAGADVTAKRMDGANALKIALSPSEDGRIVEIIKALIDAGADVNAKSDNGRTVLMYAASPRADTNVVQLLIDAGADVNATDDAGTTALDLAVADERADIVIILRAAGGGQAGIR